MCYIISSKGRVQGRQKEKGSTQLNETETQYHHRELLEEHQAGGLSVLSVSLSTESHQIRRESVGIFE